MRRRSRLMGVKREIKRLKKLTMAEVEDIEKALEEAFSGGGSGGGGEFNEGTIKI